MKKVIEVLEQPTRQDPAKFLGGLRRLLEEDDIGLVVLSLLPPQFDGSLLSCNGLVSLSRDDFIARKQALLNSARRLRGCQKQYSGPGAEPASYRGAFILDLEQICNDLGVKPVAYAVQHAKKHSAFVKFLRAVAREAVKCFAPELLPANKRPGISKSKRLNISKNRRLLSPSSMSELAKKVLWTEKLKNIKPRQAVSGGGAAKSAAKQHVSASILHFASCDSSVVLCGHTRRRE